MSKKQDSLDDYSKELRKQMFGDYEIPKKQHVLVNKFGKEIIRADSFWGLVGSMLATGLIGIIIFLIIAGICCGIGSLFN